MSITYNFRIKVRQKMWKCSKAFIIISWYQMNVIFMQILITLDIGLINGNICMTIFLFRKSHNNVFWSNGVKGYLVDLRYYLVGGNKAKISYQYIKKYKKNHLHLYITKLQTTLPWTTKKLCLRSINLNINHSQSLLCFLVMFVIIFFVAM